MTDEERNDREAIRVLMARYNICGDRADVGGLAATFTEDGVLRFDNESSIGRSAILARLLAGGSRDPGLTVSRHHLGTSLVEIAGTAATGRTYFHVLTDIGSDHHGVYVDGFRKVSGDWRIAQRDVRIDWQSPHSLNRPFWVRGKPPTERAA